LARSRIVPVNADGVGMYRDDLSLHCLDGSLGHHPDDASGDSLWVVQDRALMGASHQRTIRLVGAVGKSLGGKRETRFTGSSLVRDPGPWPIDCTTLRAP
jgi:hypothetical protein